MQAVNHSRGDLKLSDVKTPINTAILQRKKDRITQNKGHYAVQGHSRSPILVPIESLVAISD